MRIAVHRRLAPIVVGGTLVLAACGGSDDSSASLPDVQSEAASDADSDSSGGDAGGAVDPASLLDTQVDLVGEEVLPAAEIESNLLPSVVLDDVTTGRKVNFRNLVPQDKPILLWMYAPH